MGTWLTASISARLEEVEQEGWNPTTPSRHDVIQERTKEGLTGHLNCNISFMQIGRTDQFEGQEEMLVFWFRGRQIGEPIDLAESNNRAGRIKYLTSRVNRMSQLLSIVNPRRSEDSGAYSCRVYDPKTRALLGQIQFELIIDPNEEEGIETRRLSAPSVSSITVENVKAKISHSNSVETDPWVDRAEDMAYRPVTEENFLQQFSISKPTVVRISNFSTGVWISWRVNDDTANHRISKFFLQYRVLMPAAQDYGVTKTRHRFIRQSKAHDEWAAKFWSQPKDTNVSTNQSFFCLHAPMYFQPGNIYSVRIIANEDQFVQPTIQPKIYQSSWSDAISLENLLPTKPRVISLTAQNSSTLELEWTMDSQFSQSIPNTDDAHQLGLYFLLIYRTLQDAHSGSLWASCTVNGTHRDLHVTSVQWLAQPVVSDVPGEQKNYRYSIQNLRQNTTYAVAVYGVIVQNNTLSNKIPPKFTLLSETVIQKTSADFTETRVEPKKASGILEDTKVRRDEKTVEDVVSRHTAGDSEITQKSVAKHKLVNLKENHIIIVVLGSLAGVLLVVAVMLIILCLWCQIRTKRNAYSDIFKSPNKGRATVSSTEVPCAPIERGLNGHPGLSYTDAYLTDYLLAQPTTLDPNVQLLGNFTAMLKDPHSTLSWPSLAFTSDVLHHNSVGPWSNSLRQSAANPILNRYFPGGGPQPSLASNGAINGLFFATEQTSYKHTTDEDGDSAPVDSVNEESGRDRGGLGKGDQFGSIPFFPDSVEEEANAGQNDQSSSVYSHIGSISTLNELPPRIYDKNGRRNNDLNAISSPVYIPGHESQLMRPIPMYLRPQTSFPGPTTDRTGFFSAFGSGFIQPDLKPSVPLQPSLFYRTLPPRNILDPTKQLEMIQRLQSPESNPFAPIQPDHQTYGIRPSIPPIPFNNVLTSYPCRPALENHLSEPKTVLNGRGTDTYPDTASMSHLGTQQFPEKSVSGPTKNFGLPAQCEQEYPTDVDGAVQERTESHSTNKKLGSSYTDSGVDLQVSGNGNDSNGRGDVQSKLETQNLSSPDYTSPKTVDSVLQDEIRIRRPIRKHDNSGRYKSNYSSQSDGSFEGESQNCSSNKVPMMGRSCNGATDNLPKNLGRFRQTNKRPYAENDGDDALKNLMPDFIV
ncbi:hypothetical protein CLF_101941 [Clonorchis sinensis]|uniref:Ig-like domain-containing protein n=1 Tax=Clonorchis sinensis TaxID=79923 RepID=G7Y6X4_CLOSI|nr:hypothetical protein CLF_101941 [Clonorchis sinensis]